MKCDICGADAVATVVMTWDDGAAVLTNVCGDCLHSCASVAELFGCSAVGVYEPEADDAARP